MTKIKSLTVKTTFKVGLGDLDVSEEVFEELLEASGNGEELSPDSMEFPNATEWLNANIHLRDCFDCEWEIEDMEE